MPKAAKYNKETLPDLLDDLWQRTGKLPSYHQCRALGYGGGTRFFYSIRTNWCGQHGIENVTLRVRSADRAVRGAPTSECAEAIATTPNADRSNHRRPYVPDDQLSAAQLAVKQYAQSMRRNILIWGDERYAAVREKGRKK